MRPPTPKLEISREHRLLLEIVAGTARPERCRAARQRASVLLLAGDGLPNTTIAEKVGVSSATVAAWRTRYEEDGLSSIAGVRRSPARLPRITPDVAEEIVRATLHDEPPDGTRWTCRSMASAKDVSPATVQRLWTDRGVTPPAWPVKN